MLIRSMLLVMVMFSSFCLRAEAQQPTKVDLLIGISAARVHDTVTAERETRRFQTLSVNLVRAVTTYQGQMFPDPALQEVFDAVDLELSSAFECITSASESTQNYIEATNSLEQWINANYDETNPSTYADYLSQTIQKPRADALAAMQQEWIGAELADANLNYGPLQAAFTQLGLTW